MGPDEKKKSKDTEKKKKPINPTKGEKEGKTTALIRRSTRPPETDLWGAKKR